jgi:hypothetical protein
VNGSVEALDQGEEADASDDEGGWTEDQSSLFIAGDCTASTVKYIPFLF